MSKYFITTSIALVYEGGLKVAIEIREASPGAEEVERCRYIFAAHR
jgi:hypothetical protein